jgi:hypothetical protein
MQRWQLFRVCVFQRKHQALHIGGIEAASIQCIDFNNPDTICGIAYVDDKGFMRHPFTDARLHIVGKTLIHIARIHHTVAALVQRLRDDVAVHNPERASLTCGLKISCA